MPDMWISKCFIIVISDFGRSTERVTSADARAAGALTEAETRESIQKIEVGSVTVRERRAMWPTMRDLAHMKLTAPNEGGGEIGRGLVNQQLKRRKGKKRAAPASR